MSPTQSSNDDILILCASILSVQRKAKGIVKHFDNRLTEKIRNEKIELLEFLLHTVSSVLYFLVLQIEISSD